MLKSRAPVRTIAAMIVALALATLLAAPAAAIEMKDLVGVWKTLDASSPEGKAQGGIIFRGDGGGLFFSAQWDAGGNDDIVKLLLPAGADTSNIDFSYSLEQDVITTTITRFGGMDVKSDPVHWTSTLDADHKTLRMETSDGLARWIVVGLVYTQP